MQKLGFGLMRLPHDEADHNLIDKDKAKQLIDRYLAAGFHYFDTAYIYNQGNSERAFGELVADRYPREAFILTTKLPVVDLNSEEEFEWIFQEELENCHVEYFDYYFLHALGKVLYEKVERLHAFAFLAKKKAEGKIRHIGFSFHDDALTLDRILTEHPEVELVQLQINYADWENEQVQSRLCYEVCEKHGKQVAVMEPLRGGALVNIPEEAKSLLHALDPERSIASWGVRFAASLPNVMVVLSGMNSMDQLEDNLSYMKNFHPLSEREKEVVLEAAELINSKITIPCTGCGYCLDGCPKHIPIPKYFAFYNDIEAYGYHGAAINIFARMEQEYALPTICIRCHQCEKHCPQHLPIPEHLKEIGRKLCWWEYDEELFRSWIVEIPSKYTRMQIVLQDIRGHEDHILVAMDDPLERFYLRFMAFGNEQMLVGRLENDSMVLEQDTTGGFAREDCIQILEKALAGTWTVRMDKVNQALSMFGMQAVPGKMENPDDYNL